MEKEKDIALKFFELIGQGKMKEASNLFSPKCVTHNPYLPNGMDVLLESMAQVRSSKEMPSDGDFQIKHVIAEGDLVAVHTTLQSKSDRTKGLRQVHLFRFGGDKIVEYWDVTQMAPENSPNTIRMF